MMAPPPAEYRRHPPRGCSARLGAARRWAERAWLLVAPAEYRRHPPRAWSVRLGAARRWAERGCLSIALAACSSSPPIPDWQLNAKSATESSLAAYLTGNARIDAAELSRARSEIARTGRADLLARVELTHCAARVASLVYEPCAGFEALRADAPAPERAYADYLAGKLAASDAALLPEAHRGVAFNPVALGGIADPLARLVAAGVLFETQRADPSVIRTAIDTASEQGWRRPLLAWLHVELKRAEAAGAQMDADQLRRRIVIVEQQAAASAPTTR